ncbi:hypothetical protein [Ferrovibrio sp.]|uniref:hypothetical protein n=1 Tax=Ferrovibrio sp. TaxID=1917215 RepID=UPI000CBF2B38|nr:hypothetical protein [Ferrovibrio sp.]PJI38973.1 MAG: hypothetical protein CTR53_13710 [Ferrovibrio sp.]
MTFGKPPPRNPFDHLFSDQPGGGELFRLITALGQQQPPPPPPTYMDNELFRSLASMGQASAAAKALDVFGLTPLLEPYTPHSAKAVADGLGIADFISLSSINSAGALARLLEENYRSRRDWNDRFAHWQRPASVSEEGTIERAAANVRAALSASSWLVDQGLELCQQGSYFNNTNVRRDSDIDLRLVHPAVNVVFGPNVVPQYARGALGYAAGGRKFGDIFSDMRAHTSAALAKRFGAANIVPGSKAIKVRGITGSRAMVDVVPCVRLHIIDWVSDWSRYITTEGVAIIGNAGWIYNFPDLHHRNGKAKRQNTAHRFKRMVRIFKALRDDMEGRGIAGARVPSFLVECLVYAVEDGYFLHDEDLYGRVRRIALRMQARLAAPDAERTMLEISGVKHLFQPGQAWTFAQARNFMDAVVTHLGNA